jgi:hypothetical protein
MSLSISLCGIWARTMIAWGFGRIPKLWGNKKISRQPDSIKYSFLN